VGTGTTDDDDLSLDVKLNQLPTAKNFALRNDNAYCVEVQYENGRNLSFCCRLFTCTLKKAQLKFHYTESHKVSKKFRECLFWKKAK